MIEDLVVRHTYARDLRDVQHRPVRLTWRAGAPLVVELHFPGLGTVHVARDLIVAGLMAPTGDGAVRLTPLCDEQLSVVAVIRGCRWRFLLPAQPVEAVLEVSYALVPADGEAELVAAAVDRIEWRRVAA